MKDPNLLFYAYFPVEKHTSVKNRKRILKNNRTGVPFIGKDAKHLRLENELIRAFMNAKFRMEDFLFIKEYVNVKMTFHFKKSDYFTKKGEINRKIPDLSNLYQLPEDCLTKARIIEDDHYIASHDGSRRVPNDIGHFLEIEITKINID